VAPFCTPNRVGCPSESFKTPNFFLRLQFRVEAFFTRECFCLYLFFFPLPCCLRRPHISSLSRSPPPTPHKRIVTWLDYVSGVFYPTGFFRHHLLEIAQDAAFPLFGRAFFPTTLGMFSGRRGPFFHIKPPKSIASSSFQFQPTVQAMSRPAPAMYFSLFQSKPVPGLPFNPDFFFSPSESPLIIGKKGLSF